MGHWYTREGLPCHWQEDGKDTTLRHARKQGLVPSVTGILDIVDKPGLTNYLIKQTMEAAYSMDWQGVPTEEYFDEWCKEVRQKAGEHAKQARDKGSAVHKALEDDANGIEPVEHLEIVERVRAALDEEFGNAVKNLVPEATFSTNRWGGAVDLSSPELILDHKTKSSEWDLKKDGTPKKMWFESHVSQLAAYREGLGYKNALCGNVFISPSGKVYIKMYTEEEIEYGLKYFMACLNLWQVANKFGDI